MLLCPHKCAREEYPRKYLIWPRPPLSVVRLGESPLEYQMVLLRPRFGFSERDVTELMRAFRRIATVVSPWRVTAALDPSDNHVLECALEARADYIVTGNLRHFPSRFQDVRVISPRQFLLVFASQL